MYDGAVLLPAVALVDVLAVVVTAGSLHDLPRNLAVRGRGASLACGDCGIYTNLRCEIYRLPMASANCAAVLRL